MEFQILEKCITLLDYFISEPAAELSELLDQIIFKAEHGTAKNPSIDEHAVLPRVLFGPPAQSRTSLRV